MMDEPINNEGRESNELVSASRPFSRQAESFRALGGQLMLRWLGWDSERSSIAIVSPDRREGRTYIAANLGLAFAQLGRSTLLIDGDLRNPRLHALFEMMNRSGLSNALSQGEATVHHFAALPSLAVLTSGPIAPNPQQLLSGKGFLELIRSVQERYEVTIVDTPAAENSADAYIIAARAKTALIVARRGVTRVAQLESLAGRIGMTRATILGTVLNEG